MTFLQVASLCENPDLIQEPLVAQIYPPDVIERAKKMLAKVGSSIGAYSHSQGVPGIRETVAQFMLERDGHPADPNSIYLTQGASAGVQSILSILTQNEKSGILMYVSILVLGDIFTHGRSIMVYFSRRAFFPYLF